MPRLRWLLLLVFVLCSRPAAPADQPQEQLPPQYTTTVQGTVPDLTGRWLVVGYVGAQKNEGQAVPISLGWNIAQSHGKLNVVSRFGGLPPGAKAGYAAALSKHAPWEPTEEQLHEVRAGWDTVAPDRPPIASIETTIGGPDAQGDLGKTEPTLADALFTITVVINNTPGQRVTKDIMLFAAKEPAGDGYRGSYAGVTFANAPFPIPIEFTGTFRMYRLGPVPQPSWWARVVDIFKGCGQTTWSATASG